MAIKGILFDKDGTLIDFQKTWIPGSWAAVRIIAQGDEAMAEKLMVAGGLNLDTGRIEGGTPLAQSNTEQLVDGWLTLINGSTFERDELIREVDRVFVEQGAINAAPVTDLEQLTDTLQAMGIRLGIATMDSEGGVKRFLERFQIGHKFDYAVGYDSGKGCKPGPGMVIHFARQLDIDASEVLVVGDNMHDIEMGRAAKAGMVVGVLTGTSTRSELENGADYVLNSIADLPELLS